jgi:hypothetical protein
MIRDLLLALCLVLSTSLDALAQDSEVKLTPDIPAEVAPRTQAEFDGFGWKEFVALNWPANADGTPSKDFKIGENDSAARVWQYWMGPGAVLLPDGSKPTWTPGGGLTGLQLTKAAEDIQTQFVDALHFPIVDQERNFVVMGLGMNKVMFDYIVRTNLYNREGQRSDPNGRPLRVNQEKFVNFPAGSIEFKTAWRVFPENPSPADLELMKRYFISKSVVRIGAKNSEDGKDTKIMVNLGLVGMHIIQKTPGNPQWVWSTFEQVDNLEPPEPDRSKIKPTFQDPSQPPQDPILTPVPKGATPNTTDPTKPYIEPYIWALTAPYAVPNARIPTQVNRVTPIQETPGVNEKWQEALKAVNADSRWQYYQQISTQWPTRPYARKPGEKPPAGGVSIATYEGAPAPKILANVPMEVYNQKTSSCIVCHSKAFTTNGDYGDFSYVLQLAKPKKR